MIDYKVYKHTFPNGKVYIGVTRQKLWKRWYSGKGYHNNALMLEAVAEYGWSNVQHEVLYSGLTKEEALAKEKDLISFYKSDQMEYGYNICHGEFRNGIKHTDATKMKISESRKGYPAHNRKRVLQIDKDGNVVSEFASAWEAGVATHNDFRLISAVCLGKRKSTGGYKWEYAKDI